jgi:hypothetical protein
LGLEADVPIDDVAGLPRGGQAFSIAAAVGLKALALDLKECGEPVLALVGELVVCASASGW